MQGIEFEDDRVYQEGTSLGSQDRYSRPSILTRLVFKLGVTDIAVVNYILLGVAAIFFGITIFLYADMLNGPKIDRSLDAKAVLENMRRTQQK